MCQFLPTHRGIKNIRVWSCGKHQMLRNMTNDSKARNINNNGEKSWTKMGFIAKMNQNHGFLLRFIWSSHDSHVLTPNSHIIPMDIYSAIHFNLSILLISWLNYRARSCSCPSHSCPLHWLVTWSLNVVKMWRCDPDDHSPAVKSRLDRGRSMPAKWAFLPDALQPEVLFHRFPISFSYERFLFPRRRATTKVYIFFTTYQK